MTWSAAINDITANFEQDSELSDDTIFGLNAGCDSITRGAGEPIYVDPINGSASWAGTENCPKNSLSEAVSVAVASDEIILQSGNYHDNVTVNNLDNLLIRAADGADVVFDGTRSLSEDFEVTWSAADGSGIQEVTLPVPGWQLFYNYDEQVPARWPNAQFSDDTVFNRSYWAEGTLTNTNNAYTIGWLTDAGPEAGVHTGLNETINATGLDPVGAIAILNLGSFRSNSRTITDWNPANGTFAYDGNDVGWKTKHHAYFLEGKRELIDVDGEWWFDNTNSRLHYKTPSGQNANDLDIRVKVQPFAIGVTNSDGVTIQGIDFFGTTVNFNECDGCSFTNSTLESPSTSKRGLNIAGESEDDRWMTRFYRSTNSFVDKISITNVDGGAIEFQGYGGQSNNNTVNNSYFHAIDWSAADQKGLMTTIYEGGRDMTFTNNTIHLTGASSVLSIGESPKIYYNEVWDVGHLQTDGAVVQIMEGEATGSDIAYNWIHDIIKYGIRFDAPIGEPGEGVNGTIHHNVLWNASGAIMAKGDYHDISNNTVFGERVGGKNNIIILHESNFGNENSTIWNNAADALAGHRTNDIWSESLQDGTDGLNWNGYTEGYRQSLSSGYGNSNCIVSNVQSLYCWGSNAYGNLGNGLHGSGVFSDQPIEITSFGTGLYPVEVATSDSHSCAILNDGTVSCWGHNNQGQLGDGTQISRYVPTPTLSLGGGVKAVDIAVGGQHSCAVLDDGNVKCWGSNAYGQLGDGTTTDSYSPISSSGFTGTSQAIAITAGWTFTCALIEDGSVKCWGRNNLGQLGIGTSGNTPVTTPTQITSFGTGLHAVDIDGGYAQSCAVINDGRVMCWGQGSNGRLGTGNSAQQNTPTFTASLGADRYAKQVIQGGGHGCAIIDDGTVKCWGSGESTGTGTTADVYTPTTTDSLGVGRTAEAIIGGSGHTCAILDDATMACWGFGADGKLGNGASNDELSPVPVTTSGVPQNWQVSDFLVDPDNRDFRPKWGSPLHVLGAGAYEADDASPWVAGIKWSYSPLSNPTVGCTHEGALNYDSNAEFEDGSCHYITITPSATSAQLSATTPMTPITVAATTSYVTNTSLEPFTFNSVSVHQDMDIAIDRNGNSHICFRTDFQTGNLYYMTDVTGSWDFEAVHTTSSANVGLECNIEIDSNDYIHIVYQKQNSQDLRYATRAISTDGSISGHTTWSKSNLNTASDLGAYISMDIDKDDTLHVAYFQGPPSGQDLLMSKKFSGGTWSHSTIETSGSTGRYNSIVVDDSDLSVHVTYKRGSSNNLAYGIKEVGSSWSKQNVDSSNNTNGETSIAIDSNGYVHIASTSDNANELIYSTNAGGSGFVTTPIDEGTDGEQGVMIRLDDNDNVHIVYQARATDKLNYSSNAQGAWITQTLDGESTTRGKGVSMELDRNGDMHLIHLDEDTDQLRFGKFRSLANTETYEIHPDLPSGLSFGANNGTIWGTPAAGFPATDYTIYANTTTQSATTIVQLMSMWQVEPSVAGVEMMKDDTLTPITFNWTAWSSSLVNSTNSVYNSGDAGHYNSIVTDSNGKVHIVSFRDGSNDDLKYSTNASGTWQTNNIDGTGNVGQYCSIAIDSNDGLHVSYQYGSGNKLKYAYKASGSNSWTKTNVDGTGGKYTSIAIDSNDKPHIAYRDSGGDLGYAEKTGSSWTWNAIVSSVDVGWTSIAIDSNDEVHIAFYDTTGDDLHYVTDTSGSWVSSNLEDIGSAGGMAVDIAISPITDEPGISYFVGGIDDLKYRVYSGSSWTTTTILSAGSVGRYNSLVYDSQGSAHISYEKNVNDDLWYATDATGSWVTKGIHESSSSIGLYTAIAVDINDDLHIAYRHNSGQDLYHATVQGHNSGSSARSALSGATCTFSPSLPTGLSVEAGTCTISGSPTSLHLNTTHTITATSSTGLSYTGQFYLNVLAQTPVISYTGSPFTFTKDVAISTLTPTNTGGDIPLHVIDSIGDVGNYSSMVMDSNGKMHISYLDDTNGKLKYATDKSGTWVDTTIGDMMTSSTSIAVDSNNNVHIAYALNLYLQYATDKSGTWVSSQIDAQFGSGNDPSIAIDSNDKVHIAHFNAINQGYLRYSTDESGSWVHSNIFSSITNDCTFLPSIGIDSNDNIHISCVFLSVTVFELYYLTDKSGSWVSTHVDYIGAKVESSLSIDSNDKVHISYYDSTNDDLKYATDKSGSWQTSTIDSTGDSGQYSSLTIDSSDNVHISYLQNPNGDLKYATDKSGSWATSTLDTEGHIGPHNSLLVDSSGSIHVSYYDQTNGDLNYLISSTNGRQGWSISPALPTGLVFDENTGEISGTPTILQTTPATYTITATNSGGTDTAIISLSVVDALPSISYSTTVFDLIVDETMNSITPSNSGGAVTSWSISPGVPTGLNFNTATGELSGTPTIESPSQAYTVTATNSGGTDTATLTIEVLPFATLTSSVEGISDVTNSTITPITFTHTINGDTSSPSWTTGVSQASTMRIDGSFGHGIDIAQGPSGAMAMVGYEAVSDDMKLSYFYDGAWTNSVIQNSVTPLEYPSIGIDSTGVIHITYLDMTNDVLRYATNASGTWQLSDIDTTTASVLNLASGRIPGTDLAIDSTDIVHIVFSTKDPTNNKQSINYTTNQGGSWASTVISDISIFICKSPPM